MAFDAFDAFDDAGGDDGDGAATDGSPANPRGNATNGNGSSPAGAGNGAADEAGDAAFGAALEALTDDPDAGTADDAPAGAEESPPSDGTVATDVDGAIDREGETSEAAATTRAMNRRLDPEKPAYVRRLVRELRGLDERSRAMLAHYHERGPSTPIGAHLESGGEEDRNAAYAHNRRLRKGGYVRHVGRGNYAHRLAEVLAERADVALEPSVHESYVDWVVERAAPA